MARSVKGLGLLLALALMGCARDEHADADKAAILQKPFVNLKDEDTTVQSLREVAASGGSRDSKNQIMLGMERMAVRAAAEEEYFRHVRVQKGAAEGQPLLSIITIAQLLNQDARVRAAFAGKTADDFMSAAKLRN